MVSEDRSRRKTVVGRVIRNQMDKTVTVVVNRRFRHPLYKKYVSRTSKFMVHDEKNACKIGDMVRIMEIRPLSKKKRWRLVEVLEKAQ